MAAFKYPWKESFAGVPESDDKKFAVALERNLLDAMAKRRLGGTDCFSVFRKVLQETADKLDNVLLHGTLEEKMEPVFGGLRILSQHHPYGEHIAAEEVIRQIKENIGMLPMCDAVAAGILIEID